MAAPMTPLVDTHCHLQADDFSEDFFRVVERGKAAGVGCALIAGGNPLDDWESVLGAADSSGWCAALGVHPLESGSAPPESAQWLQQRCSGLLARPGSRLVAIGEIGLDGWDRSLDWKRQEEIFVSQLKVARDLGLPVTVHARHAVDAVTKWLRRVPVPGGVVHAFNGSLQQAEALAGLGFCLGFGGAMTYSGSRRIRRLAAALPLGCIVLETDCPDIPSSARRDGGSLRSEPADMLLYFEELAALRPEGPEEIREALMRNSLRCFPGMAPFLGEAPRA